MHRSSQPSSRKTKVGVAFLVSVTDEGENVAPYDTGNRHGPGGKGDRKRLGGPHLKR
jgi:hypothetical protein